VTTLPPSEEARLRQLIAKHKVVFEIRPTYVIYEGERLQVGFDVELYGTHSQAVLEGREEQPIPGCERCEQVWKDLREIATAALPPDDRPTGYYVESFDHSLRYSPKRRARTGRDRPDVELLIEVRHREGFNRDVDPCESKCVQDIVAALRALGVQERTWNDYRSQQFLQDHA
jgi:hypothetical protein